MTGVAIRSMQLGLGKVARKERTGMGKLEHPGKRSGTIPAGEKVPGEEYKEGGKCGKLEDWEGENHGFLEGEAEQ